MKSSLSAKAVALLTALSVLPALGGCGKTTPGAESPSGDTAAAPDFAVDLTTGDEFRLSDHLGKDVIVIDFWATFCNPCIQSLEHLNEIYADHKKDGLVVLAVSTDPPETAGNVKSFARTHNLNFFVAHDVQSTVTNLYNKKTVLPFSILIGRDGKIIKRRSAYQPGDEVEIRKDIESALKKLSSPPPATYPVGKVGEIGASHFGRLLEKAWGIPTAFFAFLLLEVTPA